MQARMKHPAMIVPNALQALQTLGKAVQASGVPPKTLELVHLQASQITACGVCAVQHPRISEETR